MITVAICTFNRDDMLASTLDSLLACAAPACGLEVLVVDNRSTDGTAVIAQSYAARHAAVRYVFEGEQGLSAARNRAIAEANGELIAFADDDVYFDEGWLRSLEAAFSDDPGLACVGGRVLPHFEAPRPEWLTEQMLWVYGVTRYGEVPRDLHAPEIPIGCNMAFRRAAFDRAGTFDRALGRKGQSLLSNEESDLFARMAAAGLRVGYAPDMSLRHRVPVARLQKDWVQRRYYWQGISEVVQQQVQSPGYGRMRWLGEALADMYRAVRPYMPGLESPRRLYWRLGSFSLHLHSAYRRGRARQAARSAFGG